MGETVVWSVQAGCKLGKQSQEKTDRVESLPSSCMTLDAWVPLACTISA